MILVIIGSAIIGALIVFVTASTTLWQQKKQIKQLKQELSDYQENLDKKIAEAKEEQQRTFRNERAELEAAYQAELQANEKFKKKKKDSHKHIKMVFKKSLLTF